MSKQSIFWSVLGAIVVAGIIWYFVSKGKKKNGTGIATVTNS